MALTVTHFGVTITLDAEVNVKYTATGEPVVFVPSGVKVTAISNPNFAPTYATPSGGGAWASEILQGRAMLNPVFGVAQGYNPNHGGTLGYSAAMDVMFELPLAVAPGDTLIVARCKNRVPSQAEFGKNAVELVVGFTFFTAADYASFPENAFLSHRYGTTPAVCSYDAADINWGLLPNLSTSGLSAAPSQATVEDEYKIPALPFLVAGPGAANSWEATTSCPWINAGGGYGGNNGENWGKVLSHAMMWLTLTNTNAVKSKLLYYLIQRGLDTASLINSGVYFQASGSHQPGVTGPMMLASKLLGDADTLAKFELHRTVEGRMTTWFVTESDVGRAVAPPGTRFTTAEIGRPAWGINHYNTPYNDSSSVISYRDIYIYSTTGQMLAMRKMGFVNDFAWLPAFAFAEWTFSAPDLPWGGSEFEVQYHNAHIATMPPLLASPVYFGSIATKMDPTSLIELSAGSGLTIRFTKDGSDPTIASTLYTGPIACSTLYTTSTGGVMTVTLKCNTHSVVEGMLPGPVMARTYQIDTSGKPAPPTNLQFVP